jgi:hypothetical protein
MEPGWLGCNDIAARPFLNKKEQYIKGKKQENY